MGGLKRALQVALVMKWAMAVLLLLMVNVGMPKVMHQVTVPLVALRGVVLVVHLPTVPWVLPMVRVLFVMPRVVVPPVRLVQRSGW